MTWKEFLRPTKGKIILTIVILFLYFFFTLSRGCPKVLVRCSADADMPGAQQEIYGRNAGEYFVSASRVPFSCAQVCSDEEYNIALIKAILFRYFIPTIVTYFLSLLLVFVFNEIRKK